MNALPPKYPLRFLRWFCREEFLEEMEGDLVELFEMRYINSPKKAQRLFWWDVLRSFRLVNIRSLKLNNWTMNSLRNYIKIYFRRFRKETTHYLVNTLGLAMGFAVLFFILIYSYDEHHIDSIHEKSDRIYRVLETSESEGEINTYTITANPLAGGLKEEFPEIEETARMVYMGSGGLRYGENEFQDRNYVFAGVQLFNILDFEITKGNPYQDFDGMVGVTLNETCAKKLFGDENPIGKLVDLPGKVDGAEVIAVYKDLPANVTYQFNMVFVTHFDQVPMGYAQWFEDWNSRGATTWALFKENTSPESVMEKRQAFMDKYYTEEQQKEHAFSFQLITDMHLESSSLAQTGGEPLLSVQYANKDFVLIITLIGFLVITIASLNYINLSSVQALKRNLEAGIRKINGATMAQLRFQLFVETFMTLLIAYIIALVLLVLLHQPFLDLTQKQIPVAEFFNSELLSFHLMAFVAIWILSSLVPALYYSKLNKTLVIKKNAFSGKGDVLRKSFMVVQYGISLCLIIGSIMLYRQLNYVQSKDLGFVNEHLLTLDINSRAARDHANNIIHDLQMDANVMNASVSSRVPGEWKYMPTFNISLNKAENLIPTKHFVADQYWLDTYGMQLKAGKNFSGVPSADTLKIVVNEKAVQSMGLEDPIGKSIWITADSTYKMQIIGVVKDFHFTSLREPLMPMILTSPNNPLFPIDYFTIKSNGNTAEVLDLIETVQKRYDPETPAEINFLDERWERYYKADLNRSYLILVATIISIIISAFGLFGLINFTAERKTKEVGIRKVLGASTQSILQVVLKEYAILLLIALILAVPVAYLILNNWLAGYAYRVDLSVWVFGLGFILVVGISLITVISRVYRLAKSNPVNSLRYE
ncbi:FtsX-like permease family protein [Marinoscillum pacificum]|uniref:FtsX-like permease family protein n=1 Tax=Marinoscillum pacificum TaxID=392723 RepID=UPI002157D18C|nr:FtsX-like permease family protein [Marinoscillum pacificum]